MTDYKYSLNLPETSFPMKANLPDNEPKRLKFWEDLNIYEKIRKAHKDDKTFILHDGPPYANGHLHCGHALNKILKDIIIKSKSLSGYNAPFVPGWDCHGLPIELNVEKKIGKAGHKIDAATFRIKCREYAQNQITIQKEEFKRLGVLGDWENPYTTMNFSYEADIIRALAKIIERGHLQQGFKPVHWCIDCGSSLAEAEVDYINKTSPSIDVAFFVKNPQEILKLFDSSLEKKEVIVPIWTTTPWTLPANEAVCLHPKFEYVLVDTIKNYFIIAADLSDATMMRYGITQYRIVGKKRGEDFNQISLQHPFYERCVPLVLGEHVSADAGTGCVHTAPAHGPDDYLVGMHYKLPLINPVMTNGCFAEDVQFFAGLPVLKVQHKIIETLKTANTLLHQELIEHSYPHCWRHNTAVIFLTTPQWFISMDKQKLREQVIAVFDEVTWIPNWGKARIQHMTETRPDWCISRQRAWGTPIPLFVHKTTKALHPQTLMLLEIVARKVEQHGISAWFDLDAQELLATDADSYEKINDTLDVWFDAGVSHYCVLKKNSHLSFPADLYLEGSDQYRGWFNSSITTSVALGGKSPYKTVLTHGYTVDADGKKLSKSQGNYIALDKLISQHGADILRLWVTSTDYRHEVSISEEIIKRNADAYRRIRNTARFLLANLFDFTEEENAVPEAQLLELDKMAIKRCQQLQDEIIGAFDNYNFHIIYQKIHNFCTNDLGGFYLDVIKDRQYTLGKNSIARRSCQTAMFHILHALTRWLAPILTFTAEEIWEKIPGKSLDSVLLTKWYLDWPIINPNRQDLWELLQTVRNEVNKALESQRKNGVIGSGLAADVIIYANEHLYKILQNLKDELHFIFITSSAILKPLSTCNKDLTDDTLLHNESLGLAIAIKANPHKKCCRCWHRSPDVGYNTKHPELCPRCIGNISGIDEPRYFA